MKLPEDDYPQLEDPPEGTPWLLISVGIAGAIVLGLVLVALGTGDLGPIGQLSRPNPSKSPISSPKATKSVENTPKATKSPIITRKLPQPTRSAPKATKPATSAPKTTKPTPKPRPTQAGPKPPKDCLPVVNRVPVVRDVVACRLGGGR